MSKLQKGETGFIRVSLQRLNKAAVFCAAFHMLTFSCERVNCHVPSFTAFCTLPRARSALFFDLWELPLKTSKETELLAPPEAACPFWRSAGLWFHILPLQWQTSYSKSPGLSVYFPVGWSLHCECREQDCRDWIQWNAKWVQR